MEINSREVLYKFFKKRNSVGHIFSKDMLFCDIEFKENGHERLLTEAEFDLNILLMGQFLFRLFQRTRGYCKDRASQQKEKRNYFY